jgi:hypothetical protein
VVQLHRVIDRIHAAGAELHVIGNGAPMFIAGFRETTEFPGPIYTDPSRAVYDAAELVRDGSGLGAGAPGPRVKRASGVEPRQAATPGADRVDLDLRGPVREPGDVLLGRQRGLEVLDQADVRAGPPHVVRDQVPEPGDTA